MTDVGVVDEIRTYFGYVIGGDAEAVKDGGDEGDSATEGFGEYYIIFDEDIVTVVTDDQTAGVSICTHCEVGLRGTDDWCDEGGGGGDGRS